MSYFILRDNHGGAQLPRCPVNGKASFENREAAMDWIRRLRFRYKQLSNEEQCEWDDTFPWGLPTNAYKCPLCLLFHTTVSTGPGGRRMQRGHSKKRTGRHR